MAEQFGARIVLRGIVFSHLEKELEDALLNKRQVWSKKLGRMVEKHVAVSFRLVGRRHKSGEILWYVQASFEPRPVATETSFAIGAVGVDLNADHLAVAACDRFGNPMDRFSLGFRSQPELSKGQLKAQLGDHIAEIVSYAAKVGKPIVCEKLDFAAKKLALRETASKSQREMLSYFAYNKFFEMLASACRKAGVELKRVNPAFTSVIGYYKFQGYRGYSSHELASLAIARRGMRLSERVKTRTAPTGTASIHNPGAVSSFFREKKVGHVWSYWSRHCKVIRGVMREVQASLDRGGGSFAYYPRRTSGYASHSFWAALRPRKASSFCHKETAAMPPGQVAIFAASSPTFGSNKVGLAG